MQCTLGACQGRGGGGCGDISSKSVHFGGISARPEEF